MARQENETILANTAYTKKAFSRRSRRALQTGDKPVRRLTPVFGIPLVLAAGFCRAQTPQFLPNFLLPGSPGIFNNPKPLAATPPRTGPGDVIPHCYMIFGYGRDSHGNGPFLDASGDALPLIGPRSTMVWKFKDTPALKQPPKAAPRQHSVPSK